MRRRPVLGVALVAGLLALVAGVGGRLTPARADTPLGSYSMAASAPGYEFNDENLAGATARVGMLAEGECAGIELFPARRLQ